MRFKRFDGFVVLAVILFFLFASLGHAQEAPKSTPVPADKIEAAAKPFIGTWNGISCQQPIVYGIKFKVEQTKPTEAPTATLLQTVFDGHTDLVGETWGTLAFNNRGQYTFLYVTNNTLLVTVTVVNGKLLGLVSQPPAEDATPLLFAPAGDVSLEDFVKTNANICTDVAARRKFLGIPEPPAPVAPTTPTPQNNSYHLPGDPAIILVKK